MQLMAQLIHTFTTLVKDADGRVYLAEVWGSQRDDGLWDGWLQFIAAEDGAVLRTNRETTQTHVSALTYWATGLEPVYLEGALRRASLVLPTVQR